MYFRLKDLREDKELKQKDVAEVIETSSNYYGDYETGKRDLPLERAIKLAKFYNVSLDYLAGLTNDKGGLHCNVLNQDEKLLIKNWNQLSSQDKKFIMMSIDHLIEKTPSADGKRSSD